MTWMFSWMLLACSSGPDCVSAELDWGRASAELDGESWSAPAWWSWAGETWNLDTDLEEGYRLSLVIQTDQAGASISSLLDQGEFPLTLPLLSSAEGGWALVVPESGSSFASENAAGGELRLWEHAEGGLEACFELEVSDGTDSLYLEGQARVEERVF